MCVHICSYILTALNVHMLFVCSKQTAKLIPPLVSRQYKPQQWLETVQNRFQDEVKHMAVKQAQDAFLGNAM